MGWGNMSKTKIIYIISILTLVASGIFVIRGYHFISDNMQNIYYVIYVSTLTWLLFRAKNEFLIRPHCVFFLPIFLVLLTMGVLNQIIALPLFLLYPWYRCAKTKGKIIFDILFVGVLMVFIIFCMAKLIPIDNQILYKKNSPDNKSIIEVREVDQGALGGNIQIVKRHIYFGVIERKKNHIYWSMARTT